MKSAKKILLRIIIHEVQYIESMLLSLKEDERTILRLQNKANSPQKEIEKRKQLIEEYRSYLKDRSDESSVRKRLIPSTRYQMDTKLSAS